MYKEELEGEYEIRRNWIIKRTKLRIKEASESDANNLYSLSIEIKKINDIIIEIDLKISSLNKGINKEIIFDPLIENSLSITEDTKDIDIAKAIEVLRQEQKSLNCKTTKEDIAKLHDLKIKLFSEIFNDDDQLNFITEKKELMYSSVLFDKIYSSEILDPITIIEILKIRGDVENYEWYDRSLIVSALSLSIINFKYDTKKANLLLDFITDFELNVWERALTGLTIAISYQKNRAWLRDINFLNRLKTLQNHNEIQEGLKLIDFILMNKLYEDNLFNPNLFNIELFQNPMNCFVPFYEDNEILNKAINDAETDFELGEFRKYIDDLPFMDSHKYALCLGLSSGGLSTSKLEGDRAKKFNNSLNISNYFKPFQNLISEYYCFFNHFPDKLKDDVFKKHLLLANTDLRKYILNKVTQLFLEANALFNEQKYTQAINKYEDLLKIDKFHKEALWQIGVCYIEKVEIGKALNIFLELEKDNDNSEFDLLFIIAQCYNKQKKYESSNEYCLKLELKVKNPSFKFLLLIADNFQELKNIDNANLYCHKAEDKTSNEDEIYLIAEVYRLNENHIDSLRLINKILETKKDIAKYWNMLGVINCDLFEWPLSIEALEKAKVLDSNNSYTLMSLGRSYLLSKINLDEAKKLLESAMKLKNNISGIIYGNLGHLYFLEGNSESAYINYIKCIEELNDVKDFNQKMDFDIKFLEKLELNIEDFIFMKTRVIKEFSILVPTNTKQTK